MSPHSSFLIKLLTVALKLLIVVLVAWFIRDTLLKAWQQLGRQTWNWQPLWIISAGAIYLLGLLPAGLYWHYVLKVLGQQTQLKNTLRAYYIGHLGKYVPGKAMVVVLRAGLIRAPRVDTALATVSIFYETLTMMAVGAFLAAGILAVRLREERMFFWGAIALMIISGFPILPPVFRFLAQLAGIGKSNESTCANLSWPGYTSILAGLVCMSVSWILLAASLWATFRAMGVDNIGLFEHGPEYLAAVSLSMVAGFLSFIPAGFGVRDLILLELLVRLFAISDATATVASAMLRIIWLVSELIISAILYFVKTK
ncbi:MAG TPA: lysylphosphatidylglycerol synthase domain-containing protein [Thermoguttaceae bacterium]